MNRHKSTTDKKVRVSIVMMSTFSGLSFKAPQLTPIIHHLSSIDLLADCLGIPEDTDRAEFSDKELEHLKRARVMNLIMRVSDKILYALGSKDSYLVREKIFGFFAKHFFRADGDIVLLKPRPVSLVSYYKNLGKIIVVEASEAHTQYTYESVKRECEDLEIPIIRNNYTNPKAINDFAAGVLMADRLICLSKFAAGTYESRGVDIEKIRITGLTTGMQLVNPRIDIGGEILFVSVANHSILKGTLRLLRIWKKYHIANKLMIIGGIHADLKPYINEYKDAENIIFTGSLNRDDITDIYSNNRCVEILLSVSEGYSRAVLECLSTATPVIVTPCCTCDIVEDGENGYIVNSSDDDEIYRRISEFNKMPISQYSDMSVEAYKSAARVEDNFLEKYMGAIFE